MLWRDDATLQEDEDPKTASFDRTADARTSDLPHFDLEAAALLEGDSWSSQDDDFLSDLHGGHTIDLDDQLTQPQWETQPEQIPSPPDSDVTSESPAPSAMDQHSAPVIAAADDSQTGNAIAGNDIGASAREITTGTVLRSRYVLGQVLGSGGNCTVFQAQDLHRLSTDASEGSQIAVKVLLPELRANPHALKRMKREFRQMQCLTHPGIARVFDLDFEGDDWFMTMELVNGQTVSAWMHAPVSSREALRVINSCCDALAHAHDLKILHGDLKPSNVLVAADGSIKIIDFGSAPSPGAHAHHGADLSLAATPSYASPQVLAGGPAEPRDDVFSLACLSYAILSGGLHPFARKSSLEACNAQLRPTYVPGIAPRLFEIIVRGLAWEREQRPASVREFMHALISSDLSRSSALARDSVVHQPIRSSTKEPLRTPVEAPALAPQHDGSASDERAAPESPAKVPRWLQLAPRPASPVSADAKLAERLAEKPATSLPEPEPTALVANSLQEVEQLLRVDPESAALVTLPALDADFASNSGASSLAAEYRRSLIILAIVLVGTVSFIFQALNEGPPQTPKTVASAPTAPVAAPASIPVAAPPPASEPIAEVATAAPVEVPRVPPDAPGVISFDSASIEAGSAQTLVAITLKRLQSTRGTAKVAWRIDKGTARPGIDYAPVEPQVIKFIEGQPARSIFIPLLNTGDAASARGPRTFTVSLQKVAGGPLLGSISKVSVTIRPPHDGGSSRGARSFASE